mmetsp:Transcript_33807/g.49685  ORF Transcript_33807/g.49685 Transcript_33807/m.49685 type:complete len:650 (-) Transcript_33807:149-2098(-)|eukprot:CAMPEP_0195528222 /NCGR_PEP_ID=MMETSP0794_2-20130614/30278_1 /TAXON_ID=515487 /ORGANISM="Stephanopyxis turris, Strain CCMP 815" /LENGTH=649 /DNA_ID=CAMNT_0040659317 /DNA_START=134 /DNA_END=2083 /DNA_ORIENTATION=+
MSASKPPRSPNPASAAALIKLQMNPEPELPNNVNTKEQLKLLPDDYLSDDPSRPLRYVGDDGMNYSYALKPMNYSVFFILMIELLERFTFYGINYTQTLYLTGVYNGDWNAGLDSVTASSYVSVSVAIAYTSPFFGAILADSFMGDYWTIVFGVLFFYLPGVILLALTTIPGLLGETFNTKALAIGLIGLWPIGTGMIKSIINVFGAKQHHPVLQSSLIESYYVNFYTCINVGALLGGIMVPILAQSNITLAYCIPVCTLTLGVICFVSGTPRYVLTKPKGDLLSKKPDTLISENNLSGLGIMFGISMLIIPFNVAYSQMSTTFIVQGTVMQNAFGFIDAASMNNADTISVLCFGYLIGNHLYPALAKRNIKLHTTHKFAFGSALGAMAIGCALLIEHQIHTNYQTYRYDHKVSVLWQAFPYSLIGIGEIFCVSAAYEVAFTASPPERKALASAVNLFCVGGLPNFLCIFLYHICAKWFTNQKTGTKQISRLDDYAEASVNKYFWVLFIIALSGVFINLLPVVRDWVASIEEAAATAVKTPMSTPVSTPSSTPKALTEPPARARRGSDGDKVDEEAPLLQSGKKPLKYGQGPVLYKHGSFRAGPSLKEKKQQTKKPRKKMNSLMRGLSLLKNSRDATSGNTSNSSIHST